MQYKEAHEFLDKLEDMIKFLIPNYVTEGKTQLVISIGCTGGKHRSVTLANELYDRLKECSGYGIEDRAQGYRKRCVEREIEDVIFR